MAAWNISVLSFLLDQVNLKTTTSVSGKFFNYVERETGRERERYLLERYIGKKNCRIPLSWIKSEWVKCFETRVKREGNLGGRRERKKVENESREKKLGKNSTGASPRFSLLSPV